MDIDNNILTSEVSDLSFTVTDGTKIECGEIVQITTKEYKKDTTLNVHKRFYILLESFKMAHIDILSTDGGLTYQYVNELERTYSSLALAKSSVDDFINC